MDEERQKEWAEAQKIAVSVDLVDAAKKQLLFLAEVDRNRHLYEDRVLQLAIYRYNAFWLPLLAKHLENPVSEDPLVIPLDCEWIWHCHRLNPIRYKIDCEKLYGRILGNYNVVSSVQAKSKSKTEEIWHKMYPEEPYELDINRSFSEDLSQNATQNEKFTSYDLVSAVKRQISFTYQVLRPHMSDDLFLQEAEARYKGFLHLIRTNWKMDINRFCVPTYDVDLMWHTHQLYPYLYCKDLINILGKVLQHDDTDSDRTKGSKLDTGFSETTKQWEETFGKRYWKAGTMNRGSTPTPVTHVPFKLNNDRKKIGATKNCKPNVCDKPIQHSARKVVEVFLEFVEIVNLPEGYKDNLLVSFSKKQTDKFFNTKRSLSISSVSGEKQVAYFQCEPTGEFLFELNTQSPSDKLLQKSKVLGSCSLSLQELVASGSELSADKWLLVDLVPEVDIPEPIRLHVSVSFTPPTPVPQVFHLEQSQDSQPTFKSPCFLPLLKTRNVKPAKTETNVTDDDGNVVLRLQMRNIVKDATKRTPDLLKDVYYITDSGEKHQVAEFSGGNWVIKGMHELFIFQNNYGNDGHLFELVGDKMVKLYPGRRLDFEPRQRGNQREEDFVTAVEFSADHPYGRAIALFNLMLGTIKARDQWIVLPSIVVGFILFDILNREGYSDDVVNDEHNREKMIAYMPQLIREGMVESATCVWCHPGRLTGRAAMVDGGMSGSSEKVIAYISEVNSGSCGPCGAVCGAGECEAKSGSCGGGKCGGGTCGGGKCGGGMFKNSHSADACDFADNVNSSGSAGTIQAEVPNECFPALLVEAGCSGGKCGGKCGGGKCGSGKCGGGMFKNSHSADACDFADSVKSSGSAGTIQAEVPDGCLTAELVEAGCSGGLCSGGCGGSKCGGGKCGGMIFRRNNCGDNSADWFDLCIGSSENMVKGSLCGGARCCEDKVKNSGGACGGVTYGGAVVAV